MGVCSLASALLSQAVADATLDVHGLPAGGGPALEGAKIRPRMLALLREEDDFLEASWKVATSLAAAMAFCKGVRFLRLDFINLVKK